MITTKPTSASEKIATLAEQYGSPLLLLDCDIIRKRYTNLAAALPNTDLFYAIKSQPHPTVLETLAELGCGFDIATSGEISLLRDIELSPRNTIHTHPIKKESEILDALRYGCTTFVVDNIYEIEKFIPFRNRVRLLIRISFPNPGCPVDLSSKFGCPPEQAMLLINRAEKLGINIKGLSFHAGSQCGNPDNHVYAINRCNEIIQQAQTESGKLLSVLDIGGGFPADYSEQIDISRFCQPINEVLQQLPDHIQVIAEPGRYISAAAMTSISRIVGKARRNDKTWYYIDDGVYGSFSGMIYDHAQYPLTVYSDIPELEEAVIAGPTCDSIDVIAKDILLPPLNIGDLIIGEQMGAYTSASTTDFNLVKRAEFIVINRGDIAEKEHQTISA